MGSPLGIFVSCYYEEDFIRSKLPTVQEFYNIYHPSDLIAYRIEPLIKSYSYDIDDERGEGYAFDSNSNNFNQQK